MEERIIDLKNKAQESKPMPYDIENFTFSYSYNQEDHHDFEVEEAIDQNVRLGGTYDFNFNSQPIEPFKKNDSLFMGKYWQFLKDLNFNPCRKYPTKFSILLFIVSELIK